MRIILFFVLLISVYLFAENLGVSEVNVKGTVHDSYKLLPDSSGIVTIQKVYIDSILVDTLLDTLSVVDIQNEISNLKKMNNQVLQKKLELSDAYVTQSNELQETADRIIAKINDVWMPILERLKEE